MACNVSPVAMFFTIDAVYAHLCASDAHRCASEKIGAWPSLIQTHGLSNQARKPQSYASSKLCVTHRLADMKYRATKIAKNPYFNTKILFSSYHL